MKKTLTAKQLRARASKASNLSYEAEAKERAKANRKMVGKTFKTRNSGGGDDGWWLYGKVQGTKDGQLLMFTFEQTPWGIQIEISHPRTSLNPGWLEIPKSEFLREWGQIKNLLNAVAV